MITLKLVFNDSNLQHTFRGNTLSTHYILIHKPRTTVLSRLESYNQFVQSYPHPPKLDLHNIKANPSVARGMGIDSILLISNAFRLQEQRHNPFHLLHGLTPVTKSSFTFIPSSQAQNYNVIRNALQLKSRETIYIANARTIADYLVLEKLAQNPHLIPIINNDLYRTLDLITELVHKVTSHVPS